MTGRSGLYFLQNKSSPWSLWPPKPRLTPALPACHLAQPTPGALASLLSLRLTKLIPTSGPLHLLAPLPRALFPRASQGCLLHSGLSPQVSPPQIGHPIYPGLSRNPCYSLGVTLFISFEAHTPLDLHCSGRVCLGVTT